MHILWRHACRPVHPGVCASSVRVLTPGRRVSGIRKLSRGGFFGSSPYPRRSPVPLSSRLPQSSPSLRDAPRLSLLLSLLRRWVGSTAGAAILYLLSSPTSGVYPQSVCLSVCLADPPLARTPRSGASDGSPLVCLHHDPNQNSKAFFRR